MLRVLAQYTSLTAPAVVAAGPDRLVLEHVHRFGGRYRARLDDALTRLGY
ncbi:hypothetical protein [Salinigranum halophilum]|jgi:hypothetical protein|nr:hypothetical protein [Salinigranum halophilum]